MHGPLTGREPPSSSRGGVRALVEALSPIAEITISVVAESNYAGKPLYSSVSKTTHKSWMA